MEYPGLPITMKRFVAADLAVFGKLSKMLKALAIENHGHKSIRKMVKNIEFLTILC